MILVGLFYEAVDGSLQGTMEWNTPRLSLRLVSLAKKPSTVLIHDKGGRREVEGEALVLPEPLEDLGVFVDGIVVEHDVNLLRLEGVIYGGPKSADLHL